MRLIPAELLDKIYGTRYGVVVVAAKRARQIRDGIPPLIETNARNPLTIALLELATGHIHLQPPDRQEAEAQASEAAAEGEA